MRRTGLVLLAVLTGVPFGRAQAPSSPSPPSSGTMARPTMPPLPPPAPENLIRFDYRQAELRWENGNWVVMAGNVRVKDFGNLPIEARDGLRLIRDLRLTQRGTIGSPAPVMEYWLSDGQAPQPLSTGQRLWPFDPDSLRVEQVQGHWCVRDPNRLLFAFGAHADQAQQALAVIHRYQFNEVGYLGQPVPEMIFFVSNPTLPAPSTASSKPGGAAASIGRTKYPIVIGAGGAVQSAAPPNRAGDDPSDLRARARYLMQMQVRQLDRSGVLVPEPTFLGDRVPFDWRQAQVRRQDHDWVVASGSTVLGNFGTNQMDARQAQHAIEYYRFTEERRVGAPNPIFTFFLTNGQAPRGMLSGIPSISFHADGLKLQQLGNSWAICEDGRVVLLLHGQQEEAQHVLQIIQQEHFDTLCLIGTTTPSTLAFFVRAR